MGYQSARVFGGGVFSHANYFLCLWGEDPEDEPVCADVSGASGSVGQQLREWTSK